MELIKDKSDHDTPTLLMLWHVAVGKDESFQWL